MKEINSSSDTYSNVFRSVGITFIDILTQDLKMRKELERAEAAAKSDVSVMILGETGTGKTIVAQAIHNASLRAEKSFVALNCTTLPDSLLESELFGHEKGAFTSAEKQRKGCFERADKGTIFLDEIGEMTASSQAKVLHVIEYKQFTRIGGEQLLNTDVRIITATNRDLIREIENKTFRPDLFYRLNEIVITLPPLRSRIDDVPLYVKQFIEESNEKFKKSVKKITRSAMRKLQSHKWLGNVRELKSVLRSAVAISQKDILDEDDIVILGMPVEVEIEDTKGRIPRSKFSRIVKPFKRKDKFYDESGLDEDPPYDISQDLSIETFEKEHILSVLKMVKWKKKKAAAILKISRPTLDRKIETYNLNK